MLDIYITRSYTYIFIKFVIYRQRYSLISEDDFIPPPMSPPTDTMPFEVSLETVQPPFLPSYFRPSPTWLGLFMMSFKADYLVTYCIFQYVAVNSINSPRPVAIQN